MVCPTDFADITIVLKSIDNLAKTFDALSATSSRFTSNAYIKPLKMANGTPIALTSTSNVLKPVAIVVSDAPTKPMAYASGGSAIANAPTAIVKVFVSSEVFANDFNTSLTFVINFVNVGKITCPICVPISFNVSPNIRI